MRLSSEPHAGGHRYRPPVIGPFKNAFPLSLCYGGQSLDHHFPHCAFRAEAIFQETNGNPLFIAGIHDMDRVSGVAAESVHSPAGVRRYVSTQLGIPRPEVLSRYALRENTRREHHALIRQHYGYHNFGYFPWAFRLKRLLYTRAWLSNERPGLMFDFATAWLLQHKVLLPAASTLTRIIGEVRERANRRPWRKLASLPDSRQTAQLAGLLEVPEGQRILVMEQWRKGPVAVSGPSFTEALERYTA